MAVIVLVAYVAVSFLLNIPSGGPNPQTIRLKLRSVENALSQYCMDNGYPSQAEGLAVLTNPPNGEKPYLKEFPTDGREPIEYIAPNNAKPGECRWGAEKLPFVVFSKGPDRISGTDDDIYARKKKKKKKRF